MGGSTESKGWFANLRGILWVPHIIQVLTILIAANTVLVRGYGTSLFDAHWDDLLRIVPIGQALLFLCLISFYMTAIANAMQWLLLTFGSKWIVRVRDWYRRGNNEPPEPSYGAKREMGWVFKTELLRKANSEGNSYYLDQYDEWEKAQASAYNDERQLSSHALACTVLLFVDLAYDQAHAVAIHGYSVLSEKLASPFADVVFLTLAGVLFASILSPIFSDSSIWIYCPGFPGSKGEQGSHERSNRDLSDSYPPPTTENLSQN